MQNKIGGYQYNMGKVTENDVHFQCYSYYILHTFFHLLEFHYNGLFRLQDYRSKDVNDLMQIYTSYYGFY